MTSDEFLMILGEMVKGDLHAIRQRGATLEFDARFDVTIEISESGEKAYLHAPLVWVGEENRDSVFALALQMQMFFLATEGSAFGYDMKRGCLILFHVLEVPGLTPESMLASIEGFINQVERWTDYFSGLNGKIALGIESAFRSNEIAFK